MPPDVLVAVVDDPAEFGPEDVTVRVARPARRFAEVVAFYRDAVGWPLLVSWDDHDGFDGAVFGLGGASRQLELLHHRDVSPSPTTEDQLVIYLSSGAAVAVVAERIIAAGHQPRRAPNPYWQRDGAVCFVDPDGYWLVLSPSSWS